MRVSDSVPWEWSVSTMVTSSANIVAERTVYWRRGTGPPDVGTADPEALALQGTVRASSHGSIGAAQPSTSWYLGEGSTGRDGSGDFETWVLLANPGN